MKFLWGLILGVAVFLSLSTPSVLLALLLEEETKCDAAVERLVRTVSDRTSADISLRLANKIDTFINSHHFSEKPSPTEIKFLEKMKTKSPLFKLYWAKIQNGYLKSPPKFRRSYWITFANFISSVDSLFSELKETTPGLLQQIATPYRELDFYKIWRISRFMDWAESFQSFERSRDLHLYLDSNLFKTKIYPKNGTFTQTIKFDQLRKRLTEATGLSAVAPIYFTPTSIIEVGDALESHWPYFGAINFNQVFYESLKPSHLEEIHELAEIFMSAHVGVKFNSLHQDHDRQTINADSWMLAEVAYFDPQALFVTLDYGISKRLFEVANLNHLDQLKVRREGHIQFFNGVINRYIPLLRITLKLSQGKEFSFRFIDLRSAIPKEAPPPQDILFSTLPPLTAMEPISVKNGTDG